MRGGGGQAGGQIPLKNNHLQVANNNSAYQGICLRGSGMMLFPISTPQIKIIIKTLIYIHCCFLLN